MELGKLWRARLGLTVPVALGVAFGSIGGGCYLSHTRPDLVPSTGGHVWSGTGRVKQGASSAAPPYALGLAGRDAWWSPEFGHNDTPGRDDMGLPLPADYFLTGITQRITTALHQETWLHAELTGRTDRLTLFRGTGSAAAYGFQPIEPVDGAGITEGGQTFKIVRICDLAGADNQSGDFGTSRLYLSVIACAPGGECAGGLAEVADTGEARWSVRASSAGVPQATMRGIDHARLPKACMPIATTGGGDPFDVQYVAIASPAGSDFLVFKAGALDAGPTGTMRIAKAGYQPVDLVIARKDASKAALVILWKSDAAALLEAYRITDGALSPSVILSYPASPSVQFVESPGWVTGTTNRDLFLFAPEGVYGARVDVSGL